VLIFAQPEKIERSKSVTPFPIKTFDRLLQLEKAWDLIDSGLPIKE